MREDLVSQSANMDVRLIQPVAVVVRGSVGQQTVETPFVLSSICFLHHVSLALAAYC